LRLDGDLIQSLNVWTIGDAVRAPLASLPVGRMPLPVYLGVEVVSSVLVLGGLALVPVLWEPLSPKGTALVRWTYVAWLVLLTILAVPCLPMWWQVMSQPSPSGQAIPMEVSYLLPGVVVFPFGVLLSGAALPHAEEAPADGGRRVNAAHQLAMRRQAGAHRGRARVGRR